MGAKNDRVEFSDFATFAEANGAGPRQYNRVWRILARNAKNLNLGLEEHIPRRPQVIDELSWLSFSRAALITLVEERPIELLDVDGIGEIRIQLVYDFVDWLKASEPDK